MNISAQKSRSVFLYAITSLILLMSAQFVHAVEPMTEGKFNSLSEKQKIDFLNNASQLPTDPVGTTDEKATSDDEAFCIEKYADKGYIRIDAGTASVKIGEKLTVSGTLFNNFSAPIVGGSIEAKVFKVTKSSVVGIPATSELVDTKTVLGNLAILSGNNIPFTFIWDVPLTSVNGTYKVLFFVRGHQKFDISGLYNSDFGGAGEFVFAITDERKTATQNAEPLNDTMNMGAMPYTYPSINTYPLVKGEENMMFACAFVPYAQEGSESATKLVLTLKDTDGNIIKRIEGSPSEGEFVNAVKDTFTPTKTYYSFTLVAEFMNGKTVLDSVTRTYDCSVFNACGEEEQAPVTVPVDKISSTKIWMTVALGFVVILFVGLILHIMKAFMDNRKKILLVLMLGIAGAIAFLFFVQGAFAQSVTRYVPITTSSWGNNVGQCTSPASAGSYYPVVETPPTPSCTETGTTITNRRRACTCPSGYTFKNAGTGSCVRPAVNGVVRNLGVHNRCVLVGVGGDPENYRGCEVTGTAGGTWYARFIDEGDASSFYCSFLCNDANANGVTSGYGASCASGGKPGVIDSANRCCTGTKYFGACMVTVTSVNTSNQVNTGVGMGGIVSNSSYVGMGGLNTGYTGIGSILTSFRVSPAESNIVCSVPDAPVISSFTATNGTGPASSNLSNINVGSGLVLNWTASNVASCSASGASDWIGTKTIPTGTQNVTASRNTTYVLTCTGFGGTTVTRSINVSTIGPADLVPSLPSYSAPSVARGNSINFVTNNITNAGSEVAGPYSIGGFYLDSDGDGIAEYSLSAGDISVNTAPGGSNSKTLTWTVPNNAPLGTYRVGYIADVTNVINEGAYGEGNNFSGWTLGTFTVTPANCPATTISNCVLPSTAPGSSVNGSCASGYTGNCNYTCQADGTWNGSGTNSCVAQFQCADGLDNDGDGKTDFGSGANNDSDCTSATDNTEGTTGTVSLTATPRIVEQGGQGTLGWTITGSNPTLCSIRGGTLNMTTLSTASGSQTITVNALTTYTLTCGSLTKSVTFEVVPRGFET